MPEFYSDVDTRNHFSAPQFTRTRHRYRGPRESEKINLEINQLAFAVRRLYERYSELSQDVADDLDLLIEGGTITVEDGDGQISIEGLDALAGRLEDLRKRVKTLEE